MSNETRPVRGADPTPIFNVLRRLQAAHRDVRIGQVIENAIGQRDLFYIEDADLLALLVKYEEAQW